MSKASSVRSLNLVFMAQRYTELSCRRFGIDLVIKVLWVLKSSNEFILNLCLQSLSSYWPTCSFRSIASILYDILYRCAIKTKVLYTWIIYLFHAEGKASYTNTKSWTQNRNKHKLQNAGYEKSSIQNTIHRIQAIKLTSCKRALKKVKRFFQKNLTI